MTTGTPTNTFLDYLEIMGVNALAVGHNGKAAVELYDLHRPDMVFLDLMMPEYDGFYALERIRKINPNAKVIVITADLRKDTEEKLNLFNPTEVIYKPFDPEILKELIKKHTSQ